MSILCFLLGHRYTEYGRGEKCQRCGLVHFVLDPPLMLQEYDVEAELQTSPATSGATTTVNL